MLSDTFRKHKNNNVNQNLLDNSCMHSNLFWSKKTEQERKDLFKEFLPNALEYEIVDINNDSKCECCTDMKKYDSDCKVKKSIGYNAYYIQSKYLGNEKICCFRNIKEGTVDEKVNFDQDGNYIKNLTCNPNLKPWLPGCKNSLNNFCSINGNIFQKEECISHCKRNPKDCINIKKSICNNLDTYTKNKFFCDDFCVEHEGTCDKSIISFCNDKQNLNDPICSCINADYKSDRIFNINPKCFNIDCMIHGYTTRALKSTTKQTNCPKTSCQIIVNSKNADITLKDNYIKNYCGDLDTKNFTNNQKNNLSFKNIFNYYTIISTIILLLLIILHYFL